MTEMFGSVSHPFYRSTEIFNLTAISEDHYYAFAKKWMSKNSIKLSKEIFGELYHKFDGHTWYMQRVLNRLYETALATIEIADVVYRSYCRIRKGNLSEADRLAYTQSMPVAHRDC